MGSRPGSRGTPRHHLRRTVPLLGLLALSLLLHGLLLSALGTGTGALSPPPPPVVVTLVTPVTATPDTGNAARMPRSARRTATPPVPAAATPILGEQSSPSTPDARAGAEAPPASGPPETAVVTAPAAAPASTADAALPSPSAPAETPVPAALPRDALPTPPIGRWRFLVFYGDYSEGRQLASVDYLISVDGERYELRSEGRAEGLTALFYSGTLSQVSVGRFGERGLEPERYVERRGSRPERWARVDRGTGVASFSGGQTATAPEGVQDRLSVLIQLGLMLRAAPQRAAPGTVLELHELSLRDVEQARYRVHGDEVLQADAGPVHALHLERIAPRRPDDPRIEAWLGYDRGMLPVRIRLTDAGGRVLDQFLPP